MYGKNIPRVRTRAVAGERKLANVKVNHQAEKQEDYKPLNSEDVEH